MRRVVELTVAEVLVVLGALALVVWALAPLRRWIRDRLERRLLRGRYGRVIEGEFRPADREPRGPRR